MNNYKLSATHAVLVAIVLVTCGLIMSIVSGAAPQPNANYKPEKPIDREICNSIKLTKAGVLGWRAKWSEFYEMDKKCYVCCYQNWYENSFFSNDAKQECNCANNKMDIIKTAWFHKDVNAEQKKEQFEKLASQQ